MTWCGSLPAVLLATSSPLSAHDLLFLTSYASSPQARSCLMHTASDTLSSSGLTNTQQTGYKTTEIRRSANFVLCLSTHRLWVLHDTSVLWYTDTVFHYAVHTSWNAAWWNSNLLYWTFNEIICCRRWSKIFFPSLFYCIVLCHQTIHFIWIPRVLPLAVVSPRIKLNQNVTSFAAVITL